MSEELTLDCRDPSGSSSRGFNKPTEPLSPGPYSGPMPSTPPVLTGAGLIVHTYLYEREPIYRRLHELREKGWRNPEGDKHFNRLRAVADNANDYERRHVFYGQMKSIGREMHYTTKAFDIAANPSIESLNLCMAPGGYTFAILQAHPTARISGISLPPEVGGHPMLLPHNDADPRVQVLFMDLTMLAVEFGVSLVAIPATHPDATAFSAARPFEDKRFDLVICDGQVLRTHVRAEWRQQREAVRLTAAQFILGMQRIKPGGTFVILLHKVEGWNTLRILSAFSGFAKVTLFKPKRIHAQRSSFYMVAKDVQPEHPTAARAVEGWKSDWYRATFGVEEAYSEEEGSRGEEAVQKLLGEFGGELLRLGKDVWRIQAEGLGRQKFIRDL
ncbi:MAG: hypothetical protein M1840_003372 [Geoglossum simile]|nr:MAG: hypothetical protein M1840_003372 [Geoglossum simile]